MNDPKPLTAAEVEAMLERSRAYRVSPNGHSDGDSLATCVEALAADWLRLQASEKQTLSQWVAAGEQYKSDNDDLRAQLAEAHKQLMRWREADEIVHGAFDSRDRAVAKLAEAVAALEQITDAREPGYRVQDLQDHAQGALVKLRGKDGV